MTTEKSFIDSALRGWKFNVEQADKLFGSLSPGQLEQEVASGRNRLIYLWGHLAAANDRLLPQSLKAAWQEINEKLWEGIWKFSASDWADRHTAVSAQDFEREPHRNRFGVLLGRTVHLACH